MLRLVKNYERSLDVFLFDGILRIYILMVLFLPTISPLVAYLIRLRIDALILWVVMMEKMRVFQLVIPLVEIRLVFAYFYSFMNRCFQAWSLSANGLIRSNEVCLSAPHGLTLSSVLRLEKCSGAEKNLRFTYDLVKKNFIHVNSGKCVALKESTMLELATCADDDVRMKWDIPSYRNSLKL